MLIWVLAWSSRSGTISCASCRIPTSCTISASAPGVGYCSYSFRRLFDFVLKDECIEGDEPFHTAGMQRAEYLREFFDVEAHLRSGCEMLQSEVPESAPASMAARNCGQ